MAATDGSRMSEEREAIAAELRRVRDAVSDQPVPERSPEELLPTPRPTPEPERAAPPPAPEPPALDLATPDVGRLNEVATARARGLKERVLAALGLPAASQRELNALQVQFDNRLLAWIEARLAHTHRHYDAVLGQYGRHMQEIDQRHLQLQQDLVGHVHDLVRRIDLVLGDGERNRVSLEVGLRDLRARLQALEQRLAQGDGA